MVDPTIHIIDLNFCGRSGTVGAYLIPHSHGCILVETGPRSTVVNLINGVKNLGYKVKDITDVFLTHIHMDHAGAAGWLAQHGARIHVHENGAPHLQNPEKLLASAGRIYGEKMDFLWGQFLPIDENQISIMHDDEIVQISPLTIHALDAPGHANHHLVYLIGNACFTGDIGGIRLNPRHYLSLPMPPPDLNFEKWRESIQRIQSKKPESIIPTHFGVYQDVDWHLQAVLNELDEVEGWMEGTMSTNPSLDELRQNFIEFEKHRIQKHGIEPATAEAQQIANPSYMSADGILRYWNKYRKQA